MAKRKTANEFYEECINAYHTAINGVIGKTDILEIKELEPYGEDAISDMVDDVDLDARFMKNRFQYFYVLVAMSVQYGIVFASFYKENPQMFSENIKQINRDNLNTLAGLNISSHLRTKIETGDQVYSRVFDKWERLINKKWTLGKDRDYIIASYKAAFVMGVSWYMNKTVA